MSTAVAGKGLEGIVAANSGICFIDGEAGVLAYRGIDIHELAEHSCFEETHLPALEWPPAQRTRTARILLATRPRPIPRPAHHRHAQDVPDLRHADGGAANYGVGAQFLRRRRKRQLARRQRAQGLQPHRADRHDRRHLRQDPQGPRNRSTRSLALARRQLPVDAQWRQALRDRDPHPRHRPHPPRRPRVERLHLCRPRYRRHAV